MHRLGAKAADAGLPCLPSCRNRGAMRVPCGLILLSLAVAGCTGVPPTDVPHTTTAPPSTRVGVRREANCADLSQAKRWSLGARSFELRGRARAATLWALVESWPVPPRQSVKIIWRMTGKGALRLEAFDSDGNRVRPQEGPSQHFAGSNWNRPGDEWGSSWVFPHPGCWTIAASRSQTGNGEIAFRSAAP